MVSNMDNNGEKDRLQYHLIPSVGLMNDPNGLVEFRGEYHVFFQWNPAGTTHANKHWGHFKSKDLICWQQLECALTPDRWYDKDGVYSGSAIVKDDQLWLFYTGNVKDREGRSSSYQCLAISTDGVHFEKQGPLFEHPKGFTRHVRDPKVWQDQRTGLYWMLLGAQDVELRGTALLYRSSDLYHWTLQGPFLTRKDASGYMWECPDLLTFEEKDLFIFSPQGIQAQGERFNNLYQTVAVIGRFEEDGLFIAENPEQWEELDAGFDYYAPQSFKSSDGRILQYAWLGMPEGKEMLIPTVEQGWIHALTIPREIEIQDGKMMQKPAREMRQLRCHSQVMSSADFVVEQKLDSLQQEWQVTWEKTVLGKILITIRENVTIQYDPQFHQLTVARIDWQTQKVEQRTRTLKRPLQSLQGFLDTSSLELFVNEGEEVFSLRFFARAKDQEFRFRQMVEQPVNLQFHTLKAERFIV